MSASDLFVYGGLLALILLVLAYMAWLAACEYALPWDLDVFPVHTVYSEWGWQTVRAMQQFCRNLEGAIILRARPVQGPARAFNGLEVYVTTGWNVEPGEEPPYEAGREAAV